MTNDEEDPEEVLKRKEAVARFLIAYQDEIIDQELHRYEGAALHIRLQSQCFNLYPLLVRLLASMIDNRRRRYIFNGIVGGKDIHKIASHLSTTPRAVGATFLSTVRVLGCRLSDVFDITRRYDELRKEFDAYLDSQQADDEWRKTLSQQIRCLQNHIGVLQLCRKEEEEKVKKLRQKQIDREQERWRMKARIFYLEHRMDELTHGCDGLWARLKWLWKGK